MAQPCTRADPGPSAWRVADTMLGMSGTCGPWVPGLAALYPTYVLEPVSDADYGG
jgi:hypothetical protein